MFEATVIEGFYPLKGLVDFVAMVKDCPVNAYKDIDGGAFDATEECVHFES